MSLFDSDQEIISHALNMWANHIETGDVCLSMTDAQNMKIPFKALTFDQMKFVVRLRELSSVILEK